VTLYPHLAAPGKIGTLEVRNRVVMAPIDSVYRTEDGGSTPEHRAYLAERARGGVGLIVSDNLVIEWPRGSVGAKSLRIDQDRFIPSLGELVEAVHFWDTPIVAQINHAGRQTTLGGSQGMGLVSSSAIPWPESGTIPAALTAQEIDHIRALFVAAARRAAKACFDGVEIHASHGYLLSSFLSPALNHRTDDYGGDTRKRTRLVCEIIAEIRDALGAIPLLVRINARDGIPGGIEPAEAAEVAALLAAAGADAINVTAGTYETPALTFPPMMYREGHLMDAVRQIKAAVDIPVIGVGKMSTPARAEELIAGGATDFVAIGRALLTDPHWTRKALGGQEARIRPCIACNHGCIHRIDQDLTMRCNVNPELGREGSIEVRTTASPLSILVAGAGPAGLEFALRAHDRGHRVKVCERSSVIGGQLVFAQIPDFKADLGKLVRFYAGEVALRGIDVELGRPVTRELVDELAPDLLVVATGGRPRVALTGADGQPLATFKDVFEGKVEPSGSAVVIGGGPNGCELAVFLARKGLDVKIVEIAGGLAETEDPSVRQFLAEEFARYGVEQHVGTAVTAIEAGHVVAQEVRSGAEIRIPCDQVFLATGVESDRDLLAELEGSVETWLVGDSYRAASVLEATERAARLAERLGDLIPTSVGV
jgi:2,4-dienoyl-CoA reductase-like NADH-dependent reductase (Old Yellow Enzyme family)/thioredoxin reductase